MFVLEDSVLSGYIIEVYTGEIVVVLAKSAKFYSDDIAN